MQARRGSKQYRIPANAEDAHSGRIHRGDYPRKLRRKEEYAMTFLMERCPSGLTGGNGHRAVGLAQLRTRRCFRRRGFRNDGAMSTSMAATPASWSRRRFGGVIDLLLPTHISHAEQRVRHRELPAVAVALAAVRAVIVQRAETAAFANRAVGRFDEGPLERAAAEMTHVPAQRRLVVFVAAVVGQAAPAGCRKPAAGRRQNVRCGRSRPGWYS